MGRESGITGGVLELDHTGTTGKSTGRYWAHTEWEESWESTAPHMGSNIGIFFLSILGR